MFELKMETDNAAFGKGDAVLLEVEMILLGVCAKLMDGKSEGRCVDSNGNTVGRWRLYEQTEE